ncbi:MAG: hypothetical protein Q7T18_08200, partial [Sedimentisphaerales bacterium]|nr:hypothetical protein [Sedimentisphaerales bacterium]
AMTWTRKANYFTIAASALLCISLLSLGRTMVDKSNYIGQARTRDDTQTIMTKAQTAISQLEQAKSQNTKYDAEIKKQADLLKHRDMIPLLYETLIKCLPDANDDSVRAELYKAFAAGDVSKVKETPRIERKQLFITKISLRYGNNLAEEGFEEGTMTTSSAPAGGMGIPGMGFAGMGIPGMPGGGGKVYTPPTQSRERSTQPASVTEGPTGPGFVVVIEGYSPYKIPNDLLDPAGVGTDRTKWGMVTRLENLDVICPNSPFKLYNKTNRKDFLIDGGEIDMGKPMPAGIGVEKQRKTAMQKELVDPMTDEVISKQEEVDSSGNPKRDKLTGKPLYRVNDHWFRLNLKLAWNKEEKSPTKDSTAR